MLAYGCATTAPPTREEMEPLRGIASWYGEEFSGRTTANGEIFDPTQLTAAHRTLPFGTVLDVTNALTGQTVRVRINDRGPYIGGRLIDLSYAAAQKIGLIAPGIGEVDIKVVRIGSDREPPQPFGVTVAEAPKSVPVIPQQQSPPPSDAPKVEFPLPPPTATAAPAPPPAPEPATALPAVTPTPDPVVTEPVVTEPVVKEEPVTVDRVQVETQRGDILTRKQVAADGRTIEEVPVAEAAPRTAAPPKPAPAKPPAPRAAPASPTPRHSGPRYIVQVGAFSVEANANALLERMKSIGQRAYIDKTSLYRVRIGPFATRDQAVATRAALEAKGVSAIIVTE